MTTTMMLLMMLLLLPFRVNSTPRAIYQDGPGNVPLPKTMDAVVDVQVQETTGDGVSHDHVEDDLVPAHSELHSSSDLYHKLSELHSLLQRHSTDKDMDMDTDTEHNSTPHAERRIGFSEIWLKDVPKIMIISMIVLQAVSTMGFFCFVLIFCYLKRKETRCRCSRTSVEVADDKWKNSSSSSTDSPDPFPLLRKVYFDQMDRHDHQEIFGDMFNQNTSQLPKKCDKSTQY